MNVGTLSTPVFLEIEGISWMETEFKAHSFVWESMAPIHGIGIGSFLTAGRICVFEIE